MKCLKNLRNQASRYNKLMKLSHSVASHLFTINGTILNLESGELPKITSCPGLKHWNFISFRCDVVLNEIFEYVDVFVFALVFANFVSQGVKVH